MILKKEQIDLAVNTYNKNRKLESHIDSTPALESEKEHKTAMKKAIIAVTNREPTDEQVNKAAESYKNKRSILRWDGLAPWGQAGIKNHREGIKAAFYALNT